jgi:GNAT superfamily N-acetyltransferase
MPLPPEISLRRATFDDVEAIRALIVVSARELSRGYYNDAQIAAALAHVFGVDTTLVADGTYFVAERAGELVACGGWSKRRTLFGGDQYTARDSGYSDPKADAAKIRAFFIHPNAARQGLGRAILKRCEDEARAAGFRSTELMSTLPGIEFYRAAGYVAGAPTSLTVGDGVEIGFVPMQKSL